MNSYTSYETERLILRPTSKDDADFVLELMNTPKWIENIGDRKVYSLEDASNYISVKMLPQLEKLGYGNFTIIRKSDLQKIGSVGLYQRDGLDVTDIGFAFLPSYEKMGYALESANKIKTLAKQVFGLKKISAITIEANTASQKLLEKLGLVFIKMIRIADDSEELMYYEASL